MGSRHGQRRLWGASRVSAHRVWGLGNPNGRDRPEYVQSSITAGIPLLVSAGLLPYRRLYLLPVRFASYRHLGSLGPSMVTLAAFPSL